MLLRVSYGFDSRREYQTARPARLYMPCGAVLIYLTDPRERRIIYKTNNQPSIIYKTNNQPSIIYKVNDQPTDRQKLQPKCANGV